MVQILYLIFLLVMLTMIIPHGTLQLSMFMTFRYFDIFGIFQFLAGGGITLFGHTFLEGLIDIRPDNPELLKIFDDNNIAIAADDVAHETRAFRVDASEEGDPMLALAQQFADQDYEVLLYDPQSSKNRRGEFVANLVKESGAQGLILFMQQFCDPEEMEYPYLKKALDEAGIPHIKLGVDQQMRDFGQASTAIQAFADVL